MKFRILMAGVAGIALVGCPAVAVAQVVENQQTQPTPSEGESPAPSADRSSQQDQGRDVVVVTAQKREERPIDVPMSLTAISGEELTSAGVVGTADLAQIAPGINTVNNGFGFLPVIRGIQSSGTSPGDALNVAIYLDDVSVGAPIAGIFDISDIERIEVLKGPQGTLFGRNATGGAIRIVTRTPSFSREGNISVDYGFKYDELKLNGYLTGPITDTLAGSLSFTMRKGNGYIEGIGPNSGRTYGDPDNNLLRGKLLWQPSDTFRAVLSADTWQQNNDSVFISFVRNGANPYPGFIPNGFPNGSLTYAGSTEPKADLAGSGVTLDASWDIGDLTLRSISGYRHVEVQSTADVDRTSNPLNWNAISQYENALSQEVTLTGPGDGLFAWQVGGYYFSAIAGNPYFKAGAGNGQDGEPTAGSTVTSNFTNKVRVDASAVFGEVTFNPTDQLHITGGLRQSSEKKRFHRHTLLGPYVQTDAEKTWDSTTWRGVVRYDLADDANVYASVGNGFKSGVFNAYSPLNTPVNPEKVVAYEIGAKARFGDITYTASAYRYDYEDIQLSAYVTVNGVLLVSLTNAADAQMQGVEFTADGDLGGGFSFSAGLSYEPDSDYLDYTNAQVVVPIPGATGVVNKQVIVPYDVSGTRTVRTPEVTANLRLNYETKLWGGDLLATVNAAYKSEFFWQPGEFSPEPSSTIVNGRLSWRDPSNGVTYSLYGTNLTDEYYATDFVPNIRADDNLKLPAGREIGLGVSLDF